MCSLRGEGSEADELIWSETGKEACEESDSGKARSDVVRWVFGL